MDRDDRGKPYLCSELGELPDGAIVSENSLAQMFGKHPTSIKRAVDRGELPPPTRLMGKPSWTVAAIRKHIETRLEGEAAARRRLEREIEDRRPLPSGV